MAQKYDTVLIFRNHIDDFSTKTLFLHSCFSKMTLILSFFFSCKKRYLKRQIILKAANLENQCCINIITTKPLACRFLSISLLFYEPDVKLNISQLLHQLKHFLFSPVLVMTGEKLKKKEEEEADDEEEVCLSVEETLDLVSQRCSGPKNSWIHTHALGTDALIQRDSHMCTEEFTRAG